MPIINKNFDPQSVPLKGSNLIEASAGTGKTYSIALMALRLIIEKNIPIQKILMVTFTKAAVAELELRVRRFVRLALNACRENETGDGPISNLVQLNIASLGREEVENRLSTAQLFLDEIAVLTIHSFCQKTLAEYAFETGQIFGAETISPDEFKQLAEDSFHEFWRQKITTINIELLEQLLKSGLNRQGVLTQVNEALGGKILSTPAPLPENFLTTQNQQETLDSLKKYDEVILSLKEELIAGLKNDSNLISAVDKNGHAKNAFGKNVGQGNWEAVIATINEKIEKIYVNKIFNVQIPFVERITELSNQKDRALKIFINHIGQQAFKWVESELSVIKKLRGIITFDDMISLLHAAVKNGESRQTLIAHLRKKYEAVFIDEFQDTDREQYEIFETVFGKEHILFYIGDPKQSIYGWRKADIFTYFKAAKAVEYMHKMNTNHRSAKPFIEAMNGFFAPAKDFDTFDYKEDPDAIKYLPVSSPEPNTRGSLLYQEKGITPIKISEYKNKNELLDGVITIVLDLLFSGNYFIEKEDKKRLVNPSDIGILVRSNNEGKVIKKLLAGQRIPAITIDDSKLLESDEAKDLYYVMVAVNDITSSNINRALISSLGGYTLDQLLKADEEAILKRFSTYQETWKTEGVYVMLRQFLSDHELTNILNRDDVYNPERAISNILQLVEIIHKVSERKDYDPVEQLQWLKKSIAAGTSEGDEYEQRIESDADAIKIVTIHKSKGLEYNIVIAPHLDMKSDKPHFKTLNYRRPDDGKYYTVSKVLANDDENKWYKQQNEQENRRLLYVAITRARYACFITASTRSGESALRVFLDAIKEAIKNNGREIPGLEFFETPVVVSGYRPQKEEKQLLREYAKADQFSLSEVYWRKSSYSALNPEHDIRIPIRYNGNAVTAYDLFVFRDLKKGAFTGNLLHYIFENINFTNPEYWDAIIKRAMKRVSAQQDEHYETKIREMLDHISAVKLIPGSDFSLNQLDWDKRLNELEFDFPFLLFNTDAIQSLSSIDAPFFLRSNDQLEGIMNGKMDLFFEFGGKYYILDWKSNYLGDSLADYGRVQLEEAMAVNNYHLQYHIYTVAVCKYLSLRVPGFDYSRDFGGVIYLFLRGVRQGMETGIYLTKPDERVIRQLNRVCSGKEVWV